MKTYNASKQRLKLLSFAGYSYGEEIYYCVEQKCIFQSKHFTAHCPDCAGITNHFTIGNHVESDMLNKLETVTRVEVIDQYGKVYGNNEASSVELSFQDDDRTLKVFLNKPTEISEMDKLWNFCQETKINIATVFPGTKQYADTEEGREEAAKALRESLERVMEELGGSFTKQ